VTAARVLVVVPTHDHASTIDLAVESVLRQSVGDIEVVIIGDGVGDDTRDVVGEIVAADDRVRFLDEPKSASRAETVRHRVISESQAEVVCYHGDDDLMLADHVQSTWERLREVDFTHPLPAYVHAGRRFQPHPIDIAESYGRDWHLEPGQNAISLSGAAHRIDAYRRLPAGWREPPPGVWSDHFMWQQWFSTPGFSYATGDRLTVLKFEASVRAHMTPEERRAELLDWRALATEPTFLEELSTMVAAATMSQAARYRWEAGEAEAAAQRERAAAIAGRAGEAAARDDEARAVAAAEAGEAAAASARRRADELSFELAAIRGTRTWRLHQRLAASPAVRAVARWTHREQP